MSQAQTQPIRFDDRDAFYAWAARQGGKWERHEGGFVQAMAPPERVNHSRIKARTWNALDAALRESGAACEAFVNGTAVSAGPGKDYVPDVVVSCGPKVDGTTLAVSNPVIVVEVLSPSTAGHDQGAKLDDCFGLPSVQHYLILSGDKVRVVHHQRWTDERLLTRIVGNGMLELEPPGIRVPVLELYRGTGLAGAP